MRYIDELVAIYNEEFVFNKAEVARMVKNGSFELLNFDEAKTLYAFSNRHAQVCEMFNEGLSRWSEAELMTLTKGYAVSKVREYAKSLNKVVETSSVSNKALEAEIAQLKEALAASQANEENLVAEVKSVKAKAKSLGAKLDKETKEHQRTIKDRDSIKTAFRLYSKGVVTNTASSVLGNVFNKVKPVTKVVINLGR